MTEARRAQSAIDMCRQSIATHSKSFSLAAKLLPPACRDDAAVLYAWCRRADDVVDESPRQHHAQGLHLLRQELDAVYAGEVMEQPVLTAFQDVARRREIPPQYPRELLDGMAMDAASQSYPDMRTLLLYCYRVASTVGLMMSHVIGLSRDDAMTQAAHMGIGMQLTNICRDVMEDWQRERLYLPDDLLARHGGAGLRGHLGGDFPDCFAEATARAVQELLAKADTYYRSGDAGLPALPWRAAFGVRSARLVYSDIGREIALADFDVRRGRAFVSARRKLLLVMRAAAAAVAELPGRCARIPVCPVAHAIPEARLEFSRELIRW